MSVAVRPFAIGAVLGILVSPGAASAAPPAGENFDILYYTTDEEGNRGRQLTADDMQYFVNQARCDCRQAIDARITLRTGQSSGAFDTVRIRSYVGAMCGNGQVGNNLQARPCVKVLDDFTNAYTKGISQNFDPIWLSTGVEGGVGESQEVSQATPVGTCGAGQGDGGVWICVESMNPDCQPEEFVVSGDQSINVPAGMDMMTTSGAIGFDYDPPAVTASNFTVSSGDGALLVSWDQDTTSDVFGYRVLCADVNGDPLPGKGYDLSGISTDTQGTIYFTEENLCPNGAFGPGYAPSDTDTDTGTGTGTGSDTGFPPDTDSGTTGGGTLGGPTSGYAPVAVPGLGGGGGVDCCTASPDAGCSDLPCTTQVCFEDPSCCDMEWTAACASLAASMCDVCEGGTGHCCVEHSAAGCHDPVCQAEVCAADNACCTIGWDAECVTAAASCSACAPADTSGGMTTSTSSSTGTGASIDTDTDTETGTGGGIPATGIGSLDWDYVCSGHIAANSNNRRIEGLENDVDYTLIVVAYDRAGNPTIAHENLLTGRPRPTTNFWEQCEQQGNVCGEGGFCRCRTDGGDAGDRWLFALGVWGGLSLLGRRRRRVA